MDAVLYALLFCLRPFASPGVVVALAGLVGWVNVYLWLGSLLGLVLGITVYVQEGAKNTLASWGIVLNGGFLLTIVLLLVAHR
jgi:hypothetical protein